VIKKVSAGGNQISVFTDVIVVRIFMLVVLRVKRNSSMFMEEFRFFASPGFRVPFQKVFSYS